MKLIRRKLRICSLKTFSSTNFAPAQTPIFQVSTDRETFNLDSNNNRNILPDGRCQHGHQICQPVALNDNRILVQLCRRWPAQNIKQNLNTFPRRHHPQYKSTHPAKSPLRHNNFIARESRSSTVIVSPPSKHSFNSSITASSILGILCAK